MSIFLKTKDWAFEPHSVVLTSLWLKKPAYGLNGGIEEAASFLLIENHTTLTEPEPKAFGKNFVLFRNSKKIAAITLLLSPYHGQSRNSRLITEPSEL